MAEPKRELPDFDGLLRGLDRWLEHYRLWLDWPLAGVAERRAFMRKMGAIDQALNLLVGVQTVDAPHPSDKGKLPGEDSGYGA